MLKTQNDTWCFHCKFWPINMFCCHRFEKKYEGRIIGKQTFVCAVPRDFSKAAAQLWRHKCIHLASLRNVLRSSTPLKSDTFENLITKQMANGFDFEISKKINKENWEVLHWSSGQIFIRPATYIDPFFLKVGFQNLTWILISYFQFHLLFSLNGDFECPL